MDEAQIPDQEPPEVVKKAFDDLIEWCKSVDTLEEKREIRSLVKSEENSKVYNIWFGEGTQNYGFTIVGSKQAINTYDVVDIRFIFKGPRGIAHKRLTLAERRVFLNAFEKLLLDNNFDINTYKYIPEY